MKIPSSILRIVIVAAALLAWIAPARAYDDLLAESPDHPRTWVDGATRAHQELRWSSEKHLLFADVTYSTSDFAEGPHPTQADDFSLAFPTVRFHPETGNFTAGGTVVAKLRHGLFGSSVVLAPNVSLSIHRHQGVVYGRLVSSASTEPSSSTWH